MKGIFFREGDEKCLMIPTKVLKTFKEGEVKTFKVDNEWLDISVEKKHIDYGKYKLWSYIPMCVNKPDLKITQYTTIG